MQGRCSSHFAFHFEQFVEHISHGNARNTNRILEHVNFVWAILSSGFINGFNEWNDVNLIINCQPIHHCDAAPIGKLSYEFIVFLASYGQTAFELRVKFRVCYWSDMSQPIVVV